MKRLLALAACLVLAFSLSACGGGNDTPATNPPATNPPATNEPETNPPATSEPDPTDPPADSTDPPAESTDPPAASGGNATAENLRDVAISLIDHDVSELYDAIGEPISSDYAPGCLEPNSEDGELVYDGFVVYTVRTEEREYVYDVE